MNRNLARLVYPAFRFGLSEYEAAERLVDMGVGGFCLYKGTVSSITEFTRRMRARAKGPLLFCADYEDGPGRFAEGASLLPSNMAIAASGSADLARRKGEITAAEAKAMGVHWVLAPVLDLADRPENPIVNVRAFSDKEETVIPMAEAYMNGLSSSGTLTCVKHFPGHGDTEKDSHLQLPVLKRTISQLKSHELKPFMSLCKQADSVMIGHLKIDDVDPDVPASFSKAAISGLLRETVGYDGCVVTDALSMKAVSDENSAGLMALLAGADILLVPDDPFKLLESLEKAYGENSLPDVVLERALRHQIEMIGKLGPRWLDDQPGREIIDGPAHREYVRLAAPECLAWLKKPQAQPFYPGETVRYMEPAVSDPEKWSGKAFVDELKKCGVNVVSAYEGTGGRLLAASFSRPQAYSGMINLNPSEREEILRRIEGNGKMTLVSFGSPFVFAGFAPRLETGLCAFCAVNEFQRAAARALTGKGPANGTMPVSLD